MAMRFTELFNKNLQPWSSLGSYLLLPSKSFYSDSNSIHTKLPVPAPYFIIRLLTSLGSTVCLAMDLVQGLTDNGFFESQHGKRSPNAQNKIRIAQHRILQSMSTIQITLAQFQAPTWGYLRKSPYSGCECFKVDDFGVEGSPSYRKPLDFYNSMITERAQRLDAIEDLEYTTSGRKILNTIRENLSVCYNEKPCFYLTNVDLGPRNAIFNIRGILQAIIDVDSLQFVPIDYAVQVPPGLGLEFFPESESSVWRACNQSGSSLIEQYRQFLYTAGARLGQFNLGSRFRAQLLKDSVPLIQGLQVIDEEDATFNNEWLGSETVLRLARPINR